MTTELEIDLGESPEGYKVDKTGLKVLNLGDGLSDAMDIEPVVLHAGQEVYIIVRAIKTKDSFDYTFNGDDDVSSVRLVQTVKAKAAVITDDDVARQAIARMEKKIAAAQHPGQGELPLDEVAVEGFCVVCGAERGDDVSCNDGVVFHTFPKAAAQAGEFSGLAGGLGFVEDQDDVSH